jgi:5-formyltetrahydrofolate cyclo-ligase
MDSGILEYLFSALVIFMLVSHALDRQQLRQTLRSRRRSLSRYQQHQAAKQIALRLINSPLFAKCQKIGFYLAMDGEISPHVLLRLALARGKSCYLPVLRRFPKSELAFVKITTTSRLYRHPFGMKEPRQRPRLFIEHLDLVCMPLVGFDKQGHRLGMGGGFYDRSLARCNNKKLFKLGLAHDCQEVDALMSQAWDIPLHGIITATQHIRC